MTKILRLICGSVVVGNLLFSSSAKAQTSPYCRIAAKEIVAKASLLRASIKGDRNAAVQYEQMVRTHATKLAQCRQQNWPSTQGIWLRVYPCDLRQGQLAQILDNIANFGYNRIYLNTFYDGRVLLPMQDNPTVWPSVVGQAAPKADLMAEVINQSRLRGISVYAWLFSMNFGPSYAKRADRQGAIARNGYGESNLQDPGSLPGEARVSHIFVDPYNKQAKEDLRQLVQAVAKRQPDGIVFDYIRYPHRADGVVSGVRDLMIYGRASALALLNRAVTQQGQDLIYKYMQDGKVSEKGVDKKAELWKFPEGRQHSNSSNTLNQELWQLSLAHARKGVVEFLNYVIQPAKFRGLTTGAVFFPKANSIYGNRADARLQPWEQFTSVSEWLPMSYATCGSTSCIVDEISLVMQQATANQMICPILAGYWQRSSGNRVAIDRQMLAVHQAYPQINCVSHFAYSWLDFGLDDQRRSCRLSPTKN